MNQPKPLAISFLLDGGSHPQAVIDDLWNRARGAIDPERWTLTGTAAYVAGPGTVLTAPGGDLALVAIAGVETGRIGSLLSSAAAKPGPAGVMGRLLQANLRSRQVARAVARRPDLAGVFAGSAVVVSAHVSADRAVWRLRKRTTAELVHGPVAMVHALRQLGRD